jgi:hypothetical protein
MGDMPCCLHIPVGRVGNKRKEDAIGVPMPERVFHNNPILVEYAKVLVRAITDMPYIDYPLDHMSLLRESRSLEKLLISSYCGTGVTLS